MEAPKVRRDVVEEAVSGHKIRDAYRWLEDGDSAETQAFVREQLGYARSVLDGIAGREQIRQRLTELLSIGTLGTPQVAGKFYFYSRREGRQNQPILYLREGVQGSDRVLLDPNRLAADGTIAVDWWYPSHDGKYLAYGLSSGGSEMSTLQVMETASGKLMADSIERTRAASLAWKRDNSGFYYTRYPAKGEVPAGEEVYHRRVFYHALGTDAGGDRLIFGEGRNPEDWPNVDLSEDDRWLLITVEQGWTRTELYLMDLAAGTPVKRITDGRDFLYRGEIFQGELYIISNEDAPRSRVFRGRADQPEREFWREIVPQTDAVLQNIDIIHGELVALYERNATSEIKLFRTDGTFLADVKLPGLGSVTGLGGEWDSEEMFFGFQSFTVPATVYRIDLSHSKTAKVGVPELWARIDAPSIDPADYEVKQVWYGSKDGTRVPMFLFHKKGLALNGSNPTLLTGYGGFNISLTPTFTGDRYLWLERGGVFAVANLRGGAEFGEEWHRAGMLEKKQNVFDDFIAAGEYLIAQEYTDKEHLAIRGGSNGGLLMGAALTQRPDLFRAVVCQVPLLDMLRYQNFQIAKLWIPEYGSADDPQQFEWLYAYSPYHHVKAGTEYPASYS